MDEQELKVQEQLKSKVTKALDVKPQDILGVREGEGDDEGVLFAVIEDGRKVRIAGKDVAVLTGPGYVDPDAALMEEEAN